jgi:hypothetical protein
MSKRKGKAIPQTSAARSRSAGIDAVTAKRRAAEYCLFHYPTLYTAGLPQRISQANADCWLVPIVLSSPSHGQMGAVGELRLDARTGEVLEETERSQVITAGESLYKGKRNGPAPSSAPRKRR